MIELEPLLKRDHQLVSNILLALMLEAVRVGPNPMDEPLSTREERAARDAEKHRKLVAAKATELLGRLVQPEHQLINDTFPVIEHEKDPTKQITDPVLQLYRSRYGCDEFAAFFMPSSGDPTIEQ